MTELSLATARETCDVAVQPFEDVRLNARATYVWRPEGDLELLRIEADNADITDDCRWHDAMMQDIARQCAAHWEERRHDRRVRQHQGPA